MNSIGPVRSGLAARSFTCSEYPALACSTPLSHASCNKESNRPAFAPLRNPSLFAGTRILKNAPWGTIAPEKKGGLASIGITIMQHPDSSGPFSHAGCNKKRATGPPSLRQTIASIVNQHQHY
jgi:hypothetical protein